MNSVILPAISLFSRPIHPEVSLLLSHWPIYQRRKLLLFCATYNYICTLILDCDDVWEVLGDQGSVR